MAGPIHTYDLAKLESFNAAAFRGDDTVPQHVCSFVLTLALAFNDLRDIFHVHILLVADKPKGTFKVNRHWGGYNGAWYHSVRLMTALVHELLNLVHIHHASLEHPFFKAVLKQLRPEDRRQWDSLVRVAQGKQADTPLGRFALLVRNKLSFHYDPKSIFAGYEHHFSSGCAGSESAFVSRGKMMAETRYFFADAAAKGFLTMNVGQHKGEDLLVQTTSIISDLNFTLMSIIHHFIQKRGFAYRAAKEEP